MNLKRFKIGDEVKVSSIAYVVYEGDNRRIESAALADGPKTGYIVGVAKRQAGKVIGYEQGDPEFGYVSGNYLRVEKTHWVWLVRFRLAGREHMVFDKDLELAFRGLDIGG